MTNILVAGSSVSQELANKLKVKHPNLSISSISNNHTLSSFDSWFDNALEKNLTVSYNQVDFILLDCWLDVTLGNLLLETGDTHSNLKSAITNLNETGQAFTNQKLNDRTLNTYSKNIEKFLHYLKTLFPKATIIANVFSGSDYFIDGTTIKSLDRIDLIRNNFFMFELSKQLTALADAQCNQFDRTYFIQEKNNVYRFIHFEERFFNDGVTILESIIS